MRLRFWIMVLLLYAAGLQQVFGEVKLDLQDCLDTALRNHPAVKAARGSVNSASGREVQASSSYLPQLAGSAGYSENHSTGGAFGESITKSYTRTLQVNQLLYDFGKTGNSVDAAEWGSRSYHQDLERVIQDVRLNVKQAYFALLYSAKLVLVETKRVEQAENHLRQAQAFFKAGSKPRFDVTRTEVEVNNARLGLINAKNNVRIRTIALNNAMGIDPGTPTLINDSFPSTPAIPSLETAQAEAVKHRPDLLKAEADIEAARARMAAEQSNYFPTVSANGAYNWASGTSEFGQIPGLPGQIGRTDVGNNWNAGIIVTIPLFQGGLTRGRVAEARGNLMVLEAQRDAARQSILLEVNQSYADMESADIRIDVMNSSIQKARENQELAQGRYRAGIGPYIEVTDAQLAAVQAETDHIQAQYDYQLSIARLFKAMGRTER